MITRCGMDDDRLEYPCARCGATNRIPRSRLRVAQGGAGLVHRSIRLSPPRAASSRASRHAELTTCPPGLAYSRAMPTLLFRAGTLAYSPFFVALLFLLV